MKPMAPGSLFHYIESGLQLASFRSTTLQSFTFRPINQNTKNIYFTAYLSLSGLTSASDREGIDNPFIALGASC